MRDLYTRALYKVPSQDHHVWHLYTRSPDIPGPPRSLHRSSLQDLFTRPLWEISIQELSTRSFHKTSMRDLYTRALYKISSQDPHMRHLYTRALYKISHRAPIWYISIQELSTSSLHRTPIWDISIQDLLISLDLLGLLTGAPYKISSQEKSLYKSCLQDLFTGPPYETFLYKIPWYPWTS